MQATNQRSMFSTIFESNQFQNNDAKHHENVTSIQAQEHNIKEYQEKFSDLKFFVKTYFDIIPVTKELKNEIKQLVRVAETYTNGLNTLLKVCKSLDKIKAWDLIEREINSYERHIYGGYYESVQFASMSLSERIQAIAKKCINSSAEITSSEVPNIAEVHSIAELNAEAKKFKPWLKGKRNVISQMNSTGYKANLFIKSIQFCNEFSYKIDIMTEAQKLRKLHDYYNSWDL